MKKLLILLGFLTFYCSIFGQYTGNKLPSGLTVSTTVDSADYTIIQKNGETIVKAVRMDTLKSFFSAGIIESIEPLDSVSGSTGQFIISDGSGWLAPVSAKYEGNDAYTFGSRLSGAIGSGSIVLGRGRATAARSFTINGITASGTDAVAINGAVASGDRSAAINQGTASGDDSFAVGRSSVASGDKSVALSGGTASGGKSIAWISGDASGEASTAWIGGVASGDNSTAWNGGIASGNYSTAWSSGVASGIRSTAWIKGTASGDNSTAWNGGIASGNYSTAWSSGVASGIRSTAWIGGVASGDNSTAWIDGIASGAQSTAWNNGTSQSFLETSFGQYVDTATTKTTDSWVATDRLLTIGNGTSGSPSNALVMLKNGNTTVNGNWTFANNVSVDTLTANHIEQIGTFAEIYYADASTAQSFPNGTTYTKITSFTTDGEESNCTADAANDKITITETGYYQVTGHFSTICTTNGTVGKTALFLGGVEVNKIHKQSTWSNTVSSQSGTMGGIIKVETVPIDIDVRLRHDQGAPVNFTGVYGNLSVRKIGDL